MISWFSILALAAAASMDCFVIGLNYGVKGVRIGNASNLFIALVCFAGTFCSMLAGHALSRFLGGQRVEAVGGALLLVLGLWMLKSALFPRRKKTRRHYSENPEIVDKDSSQVIELRESLLIGLLLCVNNVGIGIGGGITGNHVVATPAACAVFSAAFIQLGCGLGGRIRNRRVSKVLEMLSALLILLLGARTLLPTAT